MDMPDKVIIYKTELGSTGWIDPITHELPSRLPVSSGAYIKADLAQSLADALEFYADRDNHLLRANKEGRMDISVVMDEDDCGDKARAAIANYRKGE